MKDKEYLKAQRQLKNQSVNTFIKQQIEMYSDPLDYSKENKFIQGKLEALKQVLKHIEK